jgi:hypothetical protein
MTDKPPAPEQKPSPSNETRLRHFEISAFESPANSTDRTEVPDSEDLARDCTSSENRDSALPAAIGQAAEPAVAPLRAELAAERDWSAEQLVGPEH